MCSSTRGPAMAPSLVTWPTSTSANAPALASRISSKLQARTCATVPGALSIASSHMVWIESITTSVASVAFSRLAAMSRTLIAAASSMAESATPRRRARRRIWSIDSSPVTYRTRLPGPRERGGGLQQQRGFADAGIAADQHGRGRHQPAAQHAVEFGDAGGGPRRRFGAAGQADERHRSARRRLRRRPGCAATVSSSMVFHSPQVSQRPAHFRVTAPQAWQT